MSKRDTLFSSPGFSIQDDLVYTEWLLEEFGEANLRPYHASDFSDLPDQPNNCSWNTMSLPNKTGG